MELVKRIGKIRKMVIVMEKEILKLMLKSILPPLIGAIVYAAIYKIDFIMLFAAYMLIVMPIWLMLSNIKFILKINWIQSIIICLCFSLIITTFGALSLEVGVLFKNIRAFSLVAFIEYFKFIFILALPSNIIMTAIIAITKIFYNIYKKRRKK